MHLRSLVKAMEKACASVHSDPWPEHLQISGIPLVSNMSSLRMGTQILALGMESQSWKPENHVSPHNCPTIQSKSLWTFDCSSCCFCLWQSSAQQQLWKVYQAVWRSSLGGTFMVAEQNIMFYLLLRGWGETGILHTFSFFYPFSPSFIHSWWVFSFSIKTLLERPSASHRCEIPHARITSPVGD